MDSDEFYKSDELRYAKQKILENDYDATACRMRIFFKQPIYEFYPHDNLNAVPLIYKIQEGSEFKLATPYSIVLDPTRRLENTKHFYLFTRQEIEMYHMSFVRKNMHSKLENVHKPETVNDSPQNRCQTRQIMEMYKTSCESLNLGHQTKVFYILTPTSESCSKR